ncbi:PREDICTED: diacylglycerol kinase epsilon-like isoform X2 [Priapulus caudatus]|uniref:Diacylglycerol kinase n=1 Tax=Priapulus caudatus TaxID=37621 RepID=A0ABM1DTD2_PRICU|nr:PREDICTED: diacylglycerol kinase epsilon-like isoform X2 [Priapulus caudatus]
MEENVEPKAKSTVMWGDLPPSRISLYVAMVFLGTVLIITLIKRRKRHYEIPVRDTRKGHRWCATEVMCRPLYCAVCTSHFAEGLLCDCCGICVDVDCMTTADQSLHCKALATELGVPLTHHWVHGNLLMASGCCACGESCGGGEQLDVGDWRCCWCERSIHTHCMHLLTAMRCDLGKYKNMIVPSNCITLKQVGWKGRKHLVVDSVVPPTDDPAWSPVIVIATKQSGNRDGIHLLEFFRGILNPAQVIDIDELPLESGLEWCRMIHDHVCRVLVCGGDGTMGWVLATIDKLKLDPAPHVGLIPLGTGNDLSRVLGWGIGYSGEDIHDILDKVTQATPVRFDRWKIRIKHARHLGLRKPGKTLFMNNYVSLGVDALVTLNFDKSRKAAPGIFSNRFINKLAYVTYGTKDVLERECIDLHKKVKLELDGAVVQMPALEAIVVLNIGSWGAGVRPLDLITSVPKPVYRTDDGLLEVLGIYSSFHIAQLQVGLSEPVLLGQAKTVKLTLRGGNAPMQVDGEPWEQTPAEITIVQHNQATLLYNSEAL